MFIPVNFEVDWEKIKQNKQNQINKNNTRENSKRIPHTYQIGDLVMVQEPGIIRKLSLPRKGPFTIVQTHQNGTGTIEKQPYTTERINIRRIQPFHIGNEDNE